LKFRLKKEKQKNDLKEGASRLEDKVMGSLL